MEIDLSLLYNGVDSSIDISGDYNLRKEYYEGSDIVFLDTIRVDGIVGVNEDDNYFIKCDISGKMTILDSISLDEVIYPFNVSYDDQIEENWKKGENILDIFQFLWENTLLEVPLQFTKVEDLSKFHGDGWKLVSEDELDNRNNPFSDLLKDFDKE